MAPEALILSLGGLAGVALIWIIPARLAWDGLAAWTVLVLALLSPMSAVWLVGAGVMTPLAMALGDRVGHRGAVTLAWTAALLAALFTARDWSGAYRIGGAYFTLRNLHVLLDWWTRRLANPGIRRHLRYQLVLPLLMVGPIHRLQHFERQCERRRWETADFLTGAERALFGAAMAVVLGNWACRHIEAGLALVTAQWPAFWRDWVASAADWVQIYFTFAGFSAVALGLMLMMGLRIEENFDRPWAARDLIEFWTRWHMTLTRWCRDYVFQVVAAATRSPLLGLAAGMLAMGLWHRASAYYVLWSVWQVAGVVGTRVARRAMAWSLPSGPSAVLGPVAVLGWLSLARPVLIRVLELTPQ
ncbi:MAG TPA: MBOAT family O-acyltransferase [Stellaceae bacterium]|nr:MBOAT family O-acyltransferase [Stellaceae bacterium]